MGSFARAAALAARQHAIITTDQLLEAGLTAGAIRHARAGRRLEPVHPGVFRIAGAPATWHGRVLAACLAAGAGAVASHRSAGRLWVLLPDQDDDLVEISVEASRAPRLRGVVVHRSTDLHRRYRTVRHGVPVVNPLRTMVDLGAVLGPAAVEDALDRGLVARRFDVAAVEWALTDLARSGRSGCGVLRRVLDERALGRERPDGLLEPRMARLLREAGLPPAAFQHPVHDSAGRVVARPDFSYPDLRLLVEVDGYAAHSTPRQLQSDLDRQNELVALGWTVLRFTWHDVVRRPRRVAERVRTVLCTLSAA